MSGGVLFQYFEWNIPNDGSLYRELAERAEGLRKAGVTAIWMPPAGKGMAGGIDSGYGAYDLYDLGEFDQKGSVRTKYGTKDELLAAIEACHRAGLQVLADIVLNHRIGADETQEVLVEEVDPADRNQKRSQPYKIHAWARFLFPGRKGKYSAFQWSAEHFNAFGANADAPDEHGKIFLEAGHGFSGEVDFEFGNFDYLLGADINHYHPAVREELLTWGKWFVETTNVDGFRLDAVKHIPASFYHYWLPAMRAAFPKRELFAVGEYWSGSTEVLNKYLEKTGGGMSLFDVPLHFNFHHASQKGRDFDLRTIFDGSLVRANPLVAVTFVDNHDSQPGQSLQSPVADWFVPLAYALILLRAEGYPCLFYGNYFGNEGKTDESHKLVCHKKLIDDMLAARATFAHGKVEDYFDHPQCVGWIWTGNAEHPGAIAVVMSTGDAGVKHIQTARPGQRFRDLTGHASDPIEADGEGFADFTCPAGSLSVWVTE